LSSGRIDTGPTKSIIAIMLLNAPSIAASRFGLIRIAVLALAIMFVLTFTYSNRGIISRLSSVPLRDGGPNPSRSLLERQVAFWKTLEPILESNAPGCPSPERNGTSDAIPFDAVNVIPRPDLILLPDVDRVKMQETHTNFLQKVRDSEELKPVYSPGTRGLVSTAGAHYFPVFVTSLRMLRRTGTVLPVEVFVKDEGEYERKICDEVLPDLNARCRVLSEIVGASGAESASTKVEVAHYQLKIFAMLFSSFEEILWTDADCFPLYKPDQLFDSEPFKSTGMITWPDFWASTASPHYYSISGQATPSMTLRQSSEAGQLMLSKKNHQGTLLLSAYYNYFGPSHYFRLLSQGAPGEGDKETFLQAASAVGEPFYAVSECVKPIGHAKPDGGIAGSAMVQFDPIEDYHHVGQDKWRVVDPSVAANASRAFFVHANFPKFDPATVFRNDSETKPTLGPDGSDSRAWLVANDTLRRFGYDVEKAYWEEIRWVSCKLEDQFETWHGRSDICQRVETYWANVFEMQRYDDLRFAEDT
jgi:alpha 1,2-mannosyltransferase